MKGHEALIEMRMRGRVPSCVFLELPCGPARSWADPRLSWPVETPHLCTIGLDEGDDPARLDLRCLVGLRVHIGGEESEALEALVLAAERAMPRRLIVARQRRVVERVGEFERERFECTRVTDTEGHLSWPS